MLIHWGKKGRCNVSGGTQQPRTPEECCDGDFLRLTAALEYATMPGASLNGSGCARGLKIVPWKDGDSVVRLPIAVPSNSSIGPWTGSDTVRNRVVP